MPQHPLQRFRRYVEVNDSTGCWDWRGALTKEGYGRFWLAGQTRIAHRVAYEWFIGPITDQLDHTCRNTSCVNPFHTDDVTGAENQRREKLHNRPTCPKGHPHTGINYRGHRVCQICHTEQVRRHRRNQHAAAS